MTSNRAREPIQVPAPEPAVPCLRQLPRRRDRPRRLQRVLVPRWAARHARRRRVPARRKAGCHPDEHRPGRPAASRAWQGPTCPRAQGGRRQSLQPARPTASCSTSSRTMRTRSSAPSRWTRRSSSATCSSCPMSRSCIARRCTTWAASDALRHLWHAAHGRAADHADERRAGRLPGQRGQVAHRAARAPGPRARG